MPRLSRYIVLLDANVLYPAPIRDYLLELANLDLYKPVWTEQIQEEWISNLLVNGPDLNRSQLSKTVEAMNAAFPDANVANYEHLVTTLSLPDPKDRHALAAGIEINADILVTFNLPSISRIETKSSTPGIIIGSFNTLPPAAVTSLMDA